MASKFKDKGKFSNAKKFSKNTPVNLSTQDVINKISNLEPNYFQSKSYLMDITLPNKRTEVATDENLDEWNDTHGALDIVGLDTPKMNITAIPLSERLEKQHIEQIKQKEEEKKKDDEIKKRDSSFNEKISKYEQEGKDHNKLLNMIDKAVTFGDLEVIDKFVVDNYGKMTKVHSLEVLNKLKDKRRDFLLETLDKVKDSKQMDRFTKTFEEMPYKGNFRKEDLEMIDSKRKEKSRKLIDEEIKTKKQDTDVVDSGIRYTVFSKHPSDYDFRVEKSYVTKEIADQISDSIKKTGKEVKIEEFGEKKEPKKERLFYITGNGNIRFGEEKYITIGTERPNEKPKSSPIYDENSMEYIEVYPSGYYDPNKKILFKIEKKEYNKDEFIKNNPNTEYTKEKVKQFFEEKETPKIAYPKDIPSVFEYSGLKEKESKLQKNTFTDIAFDIKDEKFINNLEDKREVVKQWTEAGRITEKQSEILNKVIDAKIESIKKSKYDTVLNKQLELKTGSFQKYDEETQMKEAKKELKEDKEFSDKIIDKFKEKIKPDENKEIKSAEYQKYLDLISNINFDPTKTGRELSWFGYYKKEIKDNKTLTDNEKKALSVILDLRTELHLEHELEELDFNNPNDVRGFEVTLKSFENSDNIRKNEYEKLQEDFKAKYKVSFIKRLNSNESNIEEKLKNSIDSKLNSKLITKEQYDEFDNLIKNKGKKENKNEKSVKEEIKSFLLVTKKNMLEKEIKENNWLIKENKKNIENTNYKSFSSTYTKEDVLKLKDEMKNRNKEMLKQNNDNREIIKNIEINDMYPNIDKDIISQYKKWTDKRTDKNG